VRALLDLVDVARHAAAGAAAYLRAARPPAAAAWTEKAPADFVTDVDRRAEEIISTTLARRVPGSTVLGEELTPNAARATGVVWIVDPLDGTTNFLHGYPHWAVSIGCLVDGVLAVGLVHDVPRDIVYWAAAGHGAWRTGSRLRVSGLTDPRRALVGTGFPFKRMDELPRYLRQLNAVVRATSGVRRAGTASLDLADLAQGRFDAFWELSLAPWDVAAGVVLVREAGGLVTTLAGDADVLRGGSIIGGNPELHGWLLALLRAADAATPAGPVA
jgi:myo-inositol-1(or 4)-monophosphatase